MKFELVDSYLHGTSNNHKIKKGNIYMFDLDSTLIETKSGRKFSKTYDDFILMKNVNKKLLELSKFDENIIIITNQGGIKDKKDKLDFFKKKIELFEKEVHFEFEIYCAMFDDIYRKPNPTFYHIIQDKYDFKESIYVGDACGRKNDFSSSDYFFYLNSNIDKFSTPEEFFLGDKVDIDIKERYEKEIFKFLKKKEYSFKKNKKDKIEFIMMVGIPASGKSYITNKIIKYFEDINEEYIMISYDLMTKSKFNKKLKEAIDKNYHIIVDNTNTTNKRNDILKMIGNKYKNKYYKRCVFFDKSLNLVLHNNKVRYYEKLKNNENYKKVPEFVIKNMYNKMEKPTDETFDFIEKIKYNYEDTRKMFMIDI